MTTIDPNAPESSNNLIDDGDDNDDLFEVQDMLNQQPKSRSPQIGGAKSANAKKIMDDQLNLLQLDGQFSISKGYGNDQRAKLFSVGNPHIPKGQDYFLYTVFVSLSLAPHED